MSLVAPGAFVGLLVLVPLTVLHLRRHPPAQEVPSLLLWRELAPTAVVRRRRLGPPPLPILLALQSAALTTLVLALAQPADRGHATAARATAQSRAYVLDNSLWMTGVDLTPNRLAVAKRELSQSIAAAPAGVVVRLVVSAPDPQLIAASPDHANVLRALDGVRVSTAPGDLSAALALASGLDPGSPIVLSRAPEDPMPPLAPGLGSVRQLVVGSAGADQTVAGASTRCGIGGQPSRCELFASLQNTAVRPTSDVLEITAGGRALAHRTLRLAPSSNTDVAFQIPAGTAALGLALKHHSPGSVGNSSYVAVPAAATASVTVVGNPGQATSLAAALAAVPGVSVRVVPTANFRPTAARTANLIVVDGSLPPGGLPPAPALVLVDPPQLPGQQGLAPPLASTIVSGTDPSSGLLDGVDLTSLAIAGGGASRLAFPAWLQPLAWSPSGALIAAGSDGRRHMAVIAFDPSRSNLTQLPAFPALVDNIVSWARNWVPTAAVSGTYVLADAPEGTSSLTVLNGTRAVERITGAGAPIAFTAPAPGVYTVSERGSWGIRTHELAVAPAPMAAAPATVSATPAPSPSTAPPRAWWRWFVLAALLLLAAEWLYAVRRRAGAPA